MASKIITFKVSADFKDHIEKTASRKGISSTGAFIKAVLRKYTRYKEKELI